MIPHVLSSYYVVKLLQHNNHGHSINYRVNILHFQLQIKHDVVLEIFH